jgi:hypothetical protein
METSHQTYDNKLTAVESDLKKLGKLQQEWTIEWRGVPLYEWWQIFRMVMHLGSLLLRATIFPCLFIVILPFLKVRTLTLNFYVLYKICFPLLTEQDSKSCL